MNVSLGDAIESKFNSLNLLRLIAAISVIYGHANAITGNGPPDIFLQYIGYKFIGGVAVDVFFVISGFLICRSVLGPSGVVFFLASRLLRIYPALFACVLLSVFIVGYALTSSDVYFSDSQTWRYLWMNIFAYSAEYVLPGVFTDNYSSGFNGSLWSIAVEIRLYLLVLCLYVLGCFRSKHIFNILFFASVYCIYTNPEQFTWLYILKYENHRHVSLMFMIGVFSYINRHSIQMNYIFLFIILFLAYGQIHQDYFEYIYIFALPYTVFMLSFLPWGVWYNKYGDYSYGVYLYGVYLYGWPSQQIVYMFFPGVSNITHSILAILMALSCAIISWHLIESPALKYKNIFKLPTIPKRLPNE